MEKFTDQSIDIQVENSHRSIIIDARFSGNDIGFAIRYRRDDAEDFGVRKGDIILVGPYSDEDFERRPIESEIYVFRRTFSTELRVGKFRMGRGGKYLFNNSGGMQLTGVIREEAKVIPDLRKADGRRWRTSPKGVPE